MRSTARAPGPDGSRAPPKWPGDLLRPAYRGGRRGSSRSTQCAPAARRACRALAPPPSLVGEQVLAETRSAIGRVAGARGNPPRFIHHFNARLAPLRGRGVVHLATHEELHAQRRKRADLHAWIHDAGQRLEGDSNDEAHVSVALARGAAAVLTCTPTGIDSDRFLTEAAEAELAMARALRRDRILDPLCCLLNCSAVELLASALLPNLTPHPDPDLRLPAVRLETLSQLRTHEAGLALRAE